MGGENSIVPRAIIGLIAGGLVLFSVHLVLNPVPVSAGPAFVAGALAFFLMRTDTTAMSILFSAAGAGIGVVLHRGEHLSGSAPFPEVSLVQHLAVEGGIGWVAALGALLVMGIVMRVLERS